MKIKALNVTLSTVLSFGAVIALPTTLVAVPLSAQASGPHHNAATNQSDTTVVKNAILRAQHAGKTSVKVTFNHKISDVLLKTILETGMRKTFTGMNSRAKKERGNVWEARGMYKGELKRFVFTISFK